MRGALCLHIGTQNALFFVRFFLNVYLYAKCAWKKNNMEEKRRKRLAVAFSDRMRAPNSQFPPLAAHRRFPDQRRRKTKRQKRDVKKKKMKKKWNKISNHVCRSMCLLTVSVNASVVYIVITVEWVLMSFLASQRVRHFGLWLTTLLDSV